jgi:bifunctional autolysin
MEDFDQNFESSQKSDKADVVVKVTRAHAKKTAPKRKSPVRKRSSQNVLKETKAKGKSRKDPETSLKQNDSLYCEDSEASDDNDNDDQEDKENEDNDYESDDKKASSTRKNLSRRKTAPSADSKKTVLKRSSSAPKLRVSPPSSTKAPVSSTSQKSLSSTKLAVASSFHLDGVHIKSPRPSYRVGLSRRTAVPHLLQSLPKSMK